VPAATKVLLGGFATGIANTVRRVHGIVTWETDQGAADETTIGAFGMCIVSDDAQAAGAGSIPGPFTDDDSDLWFVHQYLWQRLRFVTAAGFAQIGHEVVWTIDSKAMRKFTQDEQIVIMVENGDAAAGAVCQFSIRLLTQLSGR
jgi:hypothetical protein